MTNSTLGRISPPKMWRARGDATFAKSHALENKPMSDMNQDSAKISAETSAINFDRAEVKESSGHQRFSLPVPDKENIL